MVWVAIVKLSSNQLMSFEYDVTIKDNSIFFNFYAVENLEGNQKEEVWFYFDVSRFVSIDG